MTSEPRGPDRFARLKRLEFDVLKTHALALAFVIAAAVPSITAAETVTPIGDIQRGTMVTVAGTVERILDTDDFRLADDSGSIDVYVGDNWVPADVGDQVTVHGFVDDDGSLEIYARELETPDGKVIQFAHP